MRQAEAVECGVCEPAAVDAGHDPVHDDHPRRCDRFEKARTALDGYGRDAEQGRPAAVCFARTAQTLRLSHDHNCRR